MSLPRYEKYKDSGVEWLGEVPEHWEVGAIKRYFTFLNNRRVPLSSEERGNKNGNFPYYGASGIIDWIDEYIFDDDLILVSEDGANLLNRSTPIAFIAYGCYWVNNHAHILAPPDKNLIFWSLLIESIDLVPFITGSAQPKLTYEALANILIASPTDVNEIEKISYFLNQETTKIDDLIDESTNVIVLLKEKRQALISHAVTKGLNSNVPMKDSGVEWLGEVPEHWDVIAIKWISSVSRGASPRPIDDPKYFDDAGEFAWVRISDVSASDGVLLETTQRLSELGSTFSVKIKPDELFISIAGTVGKPCISKINACIHDGFVYFPELKLNPLFLYRIFESGFCYGGLGKLGTQLNLNTDTVGSIRIGVSPSIEIDKILLFLDQETSKIDDLIAE